MLPSSRYYASWLALLRIFAGIFWLSHGVPKFTNAEQFMPPNGFISDFLQKAVAGGSGPYHDFLAGVVQPHVNIFAELVRLGEVLVGCSLLFGLLTRLGALGGMFLAANYLLGKGGFQSWAELGGVDFTAIVLSAVNLFIPTGRMLGVDALLAARKVHQRTVVPEFVDEPRAPVS